MPSNKMPSPTNHMSHGLYVSPIFFLSLPLPTRPSPQAGGPHPRYYTSTLARPPGGGGASFLILRTPSSIPFADNKNDATTGAPITASVVPTGPRPGTRSASRAGAGNAHTPLDNEEGKKERETSSGALGGSQGGPRGWWKGSTIRDVRKRQHRSKRSNLITPQYDSLIQWRLVGACSPR